MRSGAKNPLLDAHRPHLFQVGQAHHDLFHAVHLERAHAFYERYGGKTIVIARFVPVIRTYAPFVAGAARMSYPRFALYNASGAVLWVASLGYAGYFFGNIAVVKDNLTLVILGIIVLSILPGVIEYLRHRSVSPGQ